jgi:transposase
VILSLHNKQVKPLKKKTRPTYTPEFRLESANLVIEHGYSIREASEAMNVSKGSIEGWVTRLRKESKGIIGKGTPLSPEQREIRDLKKRIKRKELENEILKKATALLMSDSLENLR